MDASPFEQRSRGTVRRDRQWIEREYGREKWPAILAEARRLLDSGETRLGALLWLLTSWEYGDDINDDMDVIVLGGLVRMPAVSAIAGFYEMIRASVLQCCWPGTGTVLELCAGWGRALFLAWENGAPPHARYGALEYTEAGRDCAKLIAGRAPGMRLETAHFDLHAPDLAQWRGGDHAVVLTVYGVEQAPQICPTFFDEILALAPQVDVIHIEPIGWQCRDALGLSERQGSSQDYAIANDTNQNLWVMLKQLELQGRIEIVRSVPDAFGLNPQNAASLIHWRKRA